MGPTPSLHDATETLPSCLQTSLLLQGTAGLRSPCGHSLIPSSSTLLFPNQQDLGS